MLVNSTNTVKELALTIPGATRVFEQLGIDYCCGGARTLADACKRSRVPVSEVARRLETAETPITAGYEARNWQAESLTSLAAYIIDTHHFYAKRELIRLGNLLDKVCLAHARKHPELLDLRDVFQRLKQDLNPHMLKEEQVLFPFVARMEEAVSERRAVPLPFFGTVQNPVRMMAAEHDAAGGLLAEMRRITGGYVAPPDACVSFQALYQALPELEADLHQHIHLEHNILFPRAIEMESAVEFGRETVGHKFGQHLCFAD